MLCRSLPSHECVSCCVALFHLMSACPAVLTASCVAMWRVCAVETTCICHEDEMESASARQLLSRVYMHCEDNVESASAMKTRWRACLVECRRGGGA